MLNYRQDFCFNNLSLLKVSVGYNDNKNGPAAQRPAINVSEKSFSNENGVFVCSFSVDERMTFTKPGRFLKLYVCNDVSSYFVIQALPSV